MLVPQSRVRNFKCSLVSRRIFHQYTYVGTTQRFECGAGFSSVIPGFSTGCKDRTAGHSGPILAASLGQTERQALQ